MTVECKNCGQQWPRDPALEVACPKCAAAPGVRCKRPSEHTTAKPHADRDRLALATVPGYGKCTSGPTSAPIEPEAAETGRLF